MRETRGGTVSSNSKCQTVLFQRYSTNPSHVAPSRRTSSHVLVGSFRNCLNCSVLKCMSAWRTRHPLSSVPIEPAPTILLPPATCKHGWSKHGSSIIPSKHSIPQELYSPCLILTNYARTMFTPTMCSRRRYQFSQLYAQTLIV